jgi:hypothetical protein
LLQLSQFWNLDQATSQDQSTDIGPDWALASLIAD